MFGLCRYRNALGKPGKGIHSYRIANIAVADVALTILLAYIIWVLTECDFWLILAGCFLLGIVLHRMFCVKTTIDKFLFR